METAILRWSLINIPKFVKFYKMNINLIVGDKWLTFVQYADIVFEGMVSKGHSFTDEWILLKGFRILTCLISPTGQFSHWLIPENIKYTFQMTASKGLDFIDSFNNKIRGNSEFIRMDRQDKTE